MGAAFGIVLAITSLVPLHLRAQTATATAAPAAAGTSKPNILVINGDDIGQTNISACSLGVVGYKRRTPTASPGPA
jgi:arylsulfatase